MENEKVLNDDDRSLFVVEFVSDGRKFDMLSLCLSSVYVAPVFETAVSINFIIFDKKFHIAEPYKDKNATLPGKTIEYSKKDFDLDFEEWETGENPTIDLTELDRSGRPIRKQVWSGIEGMTYYDCENTYVYPMSEMNSLFNIDFKEHKFVPVAHWYVFKDGRTISDYETEEEAREAAEKIGGEVGHD